MKQGVIGQFDRRIRLERGTLSQTNYGAEVLTWTTLATVWASIGYSNTGSEERKEEERETSFRRVEFVIRYYEGLTAKDRVVYQDEVYDLEYVQEHRIEGGGRKRFMRLVTQVKD